METLKLIAIVNLLKKDFFIPTYQRGYRWKEIQVLDLLQDILEFQKKDKEKCEFYCLQPVVVSKKDDNSWEVIDGQQRLTTIYIILSYLENARNILFNSTNKYTISYETRQKSDYSSKTFLEEIQKTTEINYRNIDYFHISKAYLTIKDWFEDKKVNKADFLNALLKEDLRDGKDTANNVRFIWYEVEPEEEAKKIFTRINMGKIPLTNAELIKALFFINRGKPEKEREKYQQKIAYEWDNIENSLQNKNFWFFLNKSKSTKSAKIEFIFDLIANQYHKRASLKINKSIDKYYTFYIFNKLLNDEIITKRVLWDDIKIYFRTFEEWFNNNEYYHLIGYLIHIGRDIEEIKRLSKDKLKSTFKEELVTLIRNDFGKDFRNEDVNKLIELSYQEHYNIINKILLLFNVITAMRSKYTKFPFERYINEKWSLEHIHAQNSEEIKTDKQRRLILEEQKIFFEKSPKKELLHSIKQMLESKKIKEEEFILLQENIFKEYSDDTNIHSIDNLALLSSDDNSALSNNIFPIKRDKIRILDEKGSFIPICTKNVFLKYYSENVEQNVKWDKDDRAGYIRAIEKTLQDFLPLNSGKHDKK
ncbi:MAG TPA: DUF262 domain-containing protein [Candidatus Glassbacteria bacterium]|nr:DUF262 domain-containing protein [Candidatus Glassbacteria bacterium]